MCGCYDRFFEAVSLLGGAHDRLDEEALESSESVTIRMEVREEVEPPIAAC